VVEDVLSVFCWYCVDVSGDLEWRVGEVRQTLMALVLSIHRTMRNDGCTSCFYTKFQS
jgi:hypothetical protein